MKVVYDLEDGVEEPTASTCHLSSVHVLCKECSVPRYEKLELDKTYTIITVKSILQPKGVYQDLRLEWVGAVPLSRFLFYLVIFNFTWKKYLNALCINQQQLYLLYFSLLAAKTDTEATVEYFRQLKYVYPKIGGRIEFRRVPKRT